MQFMESLQKVKLKLRRVNLPMRRTICNERSARAPRCRAEGTGGRGWGVARRFTYFKTLVDANFLAILDSTLIVTIQLDFEFEESQSSLIHVFLFKQYIFRISSN